MPGRLVVLALLISSARATAEVPDAVAQAIMTCRAIEGSDQRLACFDAIQVVPSGVARHFDGFGTGSIPQFHAEAGTVVEYESGDAILLIDLLDARGEVLRNLHRAGSGIGQHVFDRSGLYKMRVTATGTWQIRLNDPRPHRGPKGKIETGSE